MRLEHHTNEEITAIQAAYEQVFRGPAADEVIKDLKKETRWNDEDLLAAGQPDVTAERLGRRALLAYILRKSGRIGDA